MNWSPLFLRIALFSELWVISLSFSCCLSPLLPLIGGLSRMPHEGRCGDSSSRAVATGAASSAARGSGRSRPYQRWSLRPGSSGPSPNAIPDPASLIPTGSQVADLSVDNFTDIIRAIIHLERAGGLPASLTTPISVALLASGGAAIPSIMPNAPASTLVTWSTVQLSPLAHLAPLTSTPQSLQTSVPSTTPPVMAPTDGQPVGGPHFCICSPLSCRYVDHSGHCMHPW